MGDHGAGVAVAGIVRRSDNTVVLAPNLGWRDTPIGDLLPVQREVLVLLDEQRRISGMLLDPPAELGLFVGRCAVPGLEAPFCQTVTIVLRDHVPTGPPDEHDKRGYHALRRIHMAQGLQLLDVLVSDGDAVRSLAIGCDPDPIWFDEFPTVA